MNQESLNSKKGWNDSTACAYFSKLDEMDTALSAREPAPWIDFVIEQTGYPREIVELDADLEADLGIDSIRKAQLCLHAFKVIGGPNRTGVSDQQPCAF